ncbi:CPBP family intramembrane glutamic endopeptidase [Krasilnikovia sp. MM14-A1259]|uniref:CPBP family intramembrane glutamic endopeptidase n=1 Tax=Krasilnikovia sp. MM14-A1259 TaxID=3373539 RepID=UPI0037F5366E
MTTLTRGRIAVFFAGFIALWVMAWLVAQAAGWTGATAYWAAAKVAVWMVYPAAFWRAPLREQLAFIGLRRRDLRRGLLWGAGAAAVWVGLAIAVAPLRGQHLAPVPPAADFLYAVLLTPVCEEWLYRGYLLPTITGTGVLFWRANLVTSVLFVAVHLVGWAFQGTLPANALSVYPVSILVLSLVLGYLRHRTGSLLAPILLHVGNNAVNLWWR